MTVVKQMYPTQPTRDQLTGETDSDDIEVVLPPEDGETEEDLVAKEQKTHEDLHNDFYKNLAEDLDEQILGKIAEEAADYYDNDLRSRDEWQKTYEKGVQLLGLSIEERTEPWEGACGVFHPLIAEAAVRFQSEAITETFSAQGICKSFIVGKTDEIREKAAKRVEEDINWRLTTQMKEYRPEHERMLWNLAIMGSAFKKVYYDPGLDRQTAVFVSAEDFVAPYGATDISTSPRLSHRMRKSKNDVKKLQVAGFYRDIDLAEPVLSTTQTTQDKVSGVMPIKDERLELIEMQLELDIEGYEDVDEHGKDTGIMLPYIVTFNKQDRAILSVYRNWKMDDPTKSRVQHFVHYIYIPGFGFYGLGLVHLVGGYASSATSILRQLVDAGTLANLPVGYKAKGMRIMNSEDPLMPGEFRDVDVPSGTLQQNLIPLPFKEPSSTLLQLFNEIVEEGRKMAAVSDVDASDMNQQAPVGTTLAILERSLKVMTAIQARLHAALKEELGLLRDIIKDQLPDEYDYDVDVPEGRRVKQEDYELAEIIPVSDPNAATMSQRVVQYQAVIQMAQANPSIYDQVELNRQMLETLGIKNIPKLIPSSEDATPQDPISENANIIIGKPVKAFAYQDHESHLRAHLAAQQDPHIMALIGQSPQAQQIAAAMAAHIAEHVAMEYRRRIEMQMGVPLPQGDEQMDPQTEKQLSAVMAQAAQQLLQQHQTEAAQQAAQQAAQDPVLQMQQQQVKNDADKNRITEKKVDNDFWIAKQKLINDGVAIDTKNQHESDMQAQKIAGEMAKNAHQQMLSAGDPMLEMANQQAAHNMSMQHQRESHAQKTTHTQQVHSQALHNKQDLHDQAVKMAEEKRKIAQKTAKQKPKQEKPNK